MCLCVCVSVRRQVAAAFARMFRKGPSEEVTFNLMRSSQLCEDLGKGVRQKELQEQ